VGSAPWLDGQYTVFGEVVDGMDVVDKIAALKTNPKDQPMDTESARIVSIRIN
jgi:cyclophilin family peptidyl-prolyl cis-trans isomerase